MAGAGAVGALAGIIIARNLKALQAGIEKAEREWAGVDGFARALLVPSVRERIAVLGQKLAAFHYSRERVWVTLHGVETDHELLGAAIDRVAAGASFQPA